jgi:hypothetical protein
MGMASVNDILSARLCLIVDRIDMAGIRSRNAWR